MQKLQKLRSLVNEQLQFNDLEQMIKELSQSDLDQEHEQELKQMLLQSGLLDQLSEKIHLPYKETVKSDEIQIKQNTALLNTVELVKLNRGLKYLSVKIDHGKAFLDLPNVALDTSQTMQLCLCFMGQRYTTKPVVCQIEPVFEGRYNFELDYSHLNVLVDIDAHLHIVCYRSNQTQPELVGASQLDWRLVFDQPSGKHVSLELKDPFNHLTVGIVELELTILTGYDIIIPRQEMQFHLQVIRSQREEAYRLFVIYAKQWWSDYLQLNPTFSARHVKFFAQNEQGHKDLVTNFVYRMQSESIPSPRHAAHFVSLLNLHKIKSFGDNAESQVWHHPSTVLATKTGTIADLSLLLTSLLLGFHMDAYCVLGTNARGEATMWVLVKGQTSEFWDPCTGMVALQIDEHGFGQVGCCFNHNSFYCNIQQDDDAKTVDFQLKNQRKWKQLSTDAIESMKKSLSPRWRLTAYPFEQDLDKVQSQLHKLIEAYREKHNLSTVWDPELSHILGIQLAAINVKQVTQSTVLETDFKACVQNYIPSGHFFRGYPTEFNHTNAPKIFTHLVESKQARQILLSVGDRVRFGLSMRVHLYPEHIISARLMLGVSLGQ